MTTLQKIQQSIMDRNYYVSSHAEEEMVDDDLERKDVENAILKGRINKKMTRDIKADEIGTMLGAIRVCNNSDERDGVKSALDSPS